jgi:hypothetical protein
MGKSISSSKKEDNLSTIPHSGLDGITIEHLMPILMFIDKLKKSFESLCFKGFFRN